MYFNEMTKEQKENALLVGKRVQEVGQGYQQKGTIIENYGSEVVINWDDEGGTDWINTNFFGRTWESIQ